MTCGEILRTCEDEPRPGRLRRCARRAAAQAPLRERAPLRLPAGLLGSTVSRLELGVSSGRPGSCQDLQCGRRPLWPGPAASFRRRPDAAPLRSQVRSQRRAGSSIPQRHFFFLTRRVSRRRSEIAVKDEVCASWTTAVSPRRSRLEPAPGPETMLSGAGTARSRAPGRLRRCYCTRPSSIRVGARRNRWRRPGTRRRPTR